jgi:aminoglycoside N3'-acetyltransferase
MVHASMRAVGGRAEDVIAALDDVTLLMMTSSDDIDPFDHLTSKCDPDNGVLAEVFRTTPGTISTNHPEGRFSARGARASELLGDPPWNDYYGPGSPLAHLCEVEGKVLRLGADEETVTLLHYAEYLANVPNKRRVRRQRPGFPAVECLDDSDGIVDWPEDYFGAILRAYFAKGEAKHGRVGGARSELLEARALVTFAMRWMEEHFIER